MEHDKIPTKLITEYFLDQDKYSKIYGPKTVVWIQLGKFYDSFSTITEGIDAPALSQVLEVKLTRRKGRKSTGPPDRLNPYMIGFPTVTLIKYLDLMIKHGYTAIVFDEKKTGKCTKQGTPEILRTLVGIFSPGVYISDSITCESNYLLCTYIKEEPQLINLVSKEKKKGLLVVGLTLIDVTTGKSIVHEFYSDKNDEQFGLDELLRIIQSYNPKMTIIYYCPIVINNKIMNDIKTYLELDRIVHNFYINDKESTEIPFFNPQIFKINYQNDFLSKIFDLNKQLIPNKRSSPLEILELEDKKYATISFIIVLSYLSENNKDIIKNLSYPEIYIYSKHLILGNNAIEQLNIIDANGMESYNKKIESLFDVVNKTSTPMGKRFLKENLTNPLSKEKKKIINNRYNIIEQLLQNDLANTVQEKLKCIYDMERLHRKMARGIITPYEFSRLDQFNGTVKEVIDIISDNKIVSALVSESVVCEFNKYVSEYQKIFDVDKMGTDIDFCDIKESFFREGIHVELDELDKKISYGVDVMERTKSVLSDLIPDNKKGTEKICLDHADHIGYYFTVTKTNEKILHTNLHSKTKVKLSDGEIIQIKKSNIEFKQTKTRTKIFIDELKEYTTNIEKYKKKLLKVIEIKFIEQILKIYEMYEILLHKIVKFISELDFLVSGALVADAYYYCKPVIPSLKECNEISPQGTPSSKESRVSPPGTSSYIKAYQIRHPIIERLSRETAYVPNDIELGNIDNKNGIILYGLNSCGKTSLMKSIGLAVVLAQIGYYVPAKEFIYEPYLALYARITGNDNLFKGLSSFMLEMTELGAIVNRTENSGSNIMVIGDEICRGTNHDEAYALVISSLICLSDSKASFIFSSHLHDVPSDPDIIALNNLRVFHLHVEYDVQADCLIFNRKMFPGIGPRSYALLVAKYVIKNEKFMTIANKVKTRISGTEDKIDIPLKQSKYNKFLLIRQCKLCGYKPTNHYHKDLESHHINFQSDCLSDGKIIDHPYLTMNELYNLVILCRTCHEKVHRGCIKIRGYLDTSIGPVLDYEIDFIKILEKKV